MLKSRIIKINLRVKSVILNQMCNLAYAILSVWKCICQHDKIGYNWTIMITSPITLLIIIGHILIHPSILVVSTITVTNMLTHREQERERESGFLKFVEMW